MILARNLSAFHSPEDEPSWRLRQGTVWDRGRPARNGAEGRGYFSKSFFALRAHCGRDARGPRQTLDAMGSLGFGDESPAGWR